MDERAMGRRKKSNPRGKAIAKMILEAYKPGSREEVQDAVKDVFGPIFEAMLWAFRDTHKAIIAFIGRVAYN